jgi:hypothetical protein
MMKPKVYKGSGQTLRNREYRSHNDYDKLSIEDLCKPLSGKITPKSKSYFIGGREHEQETSVQNEPRDQGNQ